MAQTSFNVTIDDVSPQIIYSPAAPASFVPFPNITGAWNQAFTSSGFATVPGQLGVGESLHVTQDDGADLTIGFTGSAIFLFGQAIGSTFSLSLDNNGVEYPVDTEIPSGGSDNDNNDITMLTQITGLSERDHTLKLTFHASSEDDDTNPAFFVFDRAVVTTQTNVTNATVSTQTINNAQMTFSGSWTPNRDPALIPDGDNSYRITQTSGDSAEHSFQGSSIAVTGLINATAALFNVSLSSNKSSIVVQEQLSSFSPFLVYTTLFSASGLDPDATYTLTITNVQNRSLALTGLNVTVVSGGSADPAAMPTASTSSAAANSRRGLSQGAIAGLAIGLALIVVLLIVAAALLYVKKRRLRWWGGQRHTGLHATDNAFDQQQHRCRVQPSSLVDAVHRTPGQGLETPSPKVLSYDYRSVARDDGMMMEIGVGDDGDSDLGHGYHQKKPTTSLYTTQPFVNEAQDADAGAVAESKNRQSAQSVTRWSTIFGSPTQSTFRRSQIAPGSRDVPAIPNLPILAPIPKRVMPPKSVLTKEKLRHPSRSSSLSGSMSDDGFLELPRTSPFEVEFGRNSSERSSERRINRQRSRNFVESSTGHTAREALTSFLDFASSAASSFRGSSRSRSRKRRSDSTRSAFSKGTGTQRSRRAQNRDSGSGSNSTTGVWTVTLSVDRNGGQRSPGPHLSLHSASPHPFALGPDAEQPDSPTDSLPMSVSDINFRVDEDDEEPVQSRPGHFLPPHPPLPDTPRSFALRSFTPNRSLLQLSSPAASMTETRQPVVPQTVIGRRLAAARAQTQKSSSDAAAESRSDTSCRPYTHNPSASILTIISDRRRPSRTHSRNTSFMHFGRNPS